MIRTLDRTGPSGEDGRLAASASSTDACAASSNQSSLSDPSRSFATSKGWGTFVDCWYSIRVPPGGDRRSPRVDDRRVLLASSSMIRRGAAPPPLVRASTVLPDGSPGGPPIAHTRAGPLEGPISSARDAGATRAVAAADEVVDDQGEEVRIDVLEPLGGLGTVLLVLTEHVVEERDDMAGLAAAWAGKWSVGHIEEQTPGGDDYRVDRVEGEGLTEQGGEVLRATSTSEAVGRSSHPGGAGVAGA